MSIEIDSDGFMVSAATVAQTIPIDPDSDAYARFVKMVSMRDGVRGSSKQDYRAIPKSYESLQKGCEYFCSATAMLEYCKNRGLTLFAERDRVVSGPVIILEHSPSANVAVTIAANREISFIGIFAARPLIGIDRDQGFNGLVQTKHVAFFVSHTLMRALTVSPSARSEAWKLFSAPVERTFVYVDVSEFSQHPVGHQLIIIKSLIEITQSSNYSRSTKVADAIKDLEASLCIGDGYIYVFPSPHLGTFFAAAMASYLEHAIARNDLIPFHFRIAVHTGEAYRFWDKGPGKGAWNYVGAGITDGQRVLSAIGPDKDDVVYVSAENRSKILSTAEPESVYYAEPWLHNRGRHKDKHGEKRRLYEVDHAAWMYSMRTLVPDIYKPRQDG